MPKYMNNRFGLSMNLQFFADGDGAGDDAGDGGDQDEDSDNDDADEDGDDEPKFTQADLDKAVARTIAKERAKAERAEKRKKQEKEDSGAEESEDVKARKKAEARAIKAETRAACFEAGVDKDAIDDVTALAHAYMAADEDLDLEDAIEKVVKKYPQFKKGSADPEEEEDGTKTGKWGQRQNRAPKKMSGVEQRFYELNPDLKK